MFSGILSSLSRLSIGTVGAMARNISTNTFPLCLKATEPLWAEPMKKKRRLDPMIIRRRIDRKRRKLEKAIRKLQKLSRTPKPILENEIPIVIFTENKQRLRKLPTISPEVEEERILLNKEWAHYKLLEYRRDMVTLENIRFSQQKALDELRKESEFLYSEAIQCDSAYLPVEIHGPTLTPPIDKYNAPDGDYHDVTKKYDGE